MSKFWKILFIALCLLNVWHCFQTLWLHQMVVINQKNFESEVRHNDMVREMIWDCIISIEKQGG